MSGPAAAYSSSEYCRPVVKVDQGGIKGFDCIVACTVHEPFRACDAGKVEIDEVFVDGVVGRRHDGLDFFTIPIVLVDDFGIGFPRKAGAFDEYESVSNGSI